jgi:hypothetical protein
MTVATVNAIVSPPLGFPLSQTGDFLHNLDVGDFDEHARELKDQNKQHRIQIGDKIELVSHDQQIKRIEENHIHQEEYQAGGIDDQFDKSFDQKGPVKLLV